MRDRGRTWGLDSLYCIITFSAAHTCRLRGCNTQYFDVYETHRIVFQISQTAIRSLKAKKDVVYMFLEKCWGGRLKSSSSWQPLNVGIQSVRPGRQSHIRSMKHEMTASLERLKNECVSTVRLTTEGPQHLVIQPARSDWLVLLRTA